MPLSPRRLKPSRSPSKGTEPRDIPLDLDGSGYDGGGQSMV